VVASGKSEPMAVVGEGFVPWANGLGVIVFVAVLVWMYRSIRNRAARADVENHPSAPSNG
jgi:hypothetical protein